MQQEVNYKTIRNYNPEGERWLWAAVFLMMLSVFFMPDVDRLIKNDPMAPPPMIAPRKQKKDETEPATDMDGDGRKYFWRPRPILDTIQHYGLALKQIPRLTVKTQQTVYSWN